MGKFKDAYSGFSSTPKAAAVPDWPKVCSVVGCEHDTAVVHMTVRDEMGRTRTAPGGRYTHYRQGGGIGMNDGYHFVRWVARCCWHQSEDTRLAEGRDDLPQAEYTPRTPAARREYLAVAKNMVAGRRR